MVQQGKAGDPNPFISLTLKGQEHAQQIAPISRFQMRSTSPEPARSKLHRHEIYSRRSDEFITALRKSGFGPFQQIRLDVYEKIENLAGQKRTVPKLIRDAINEVRKDREYSESEGRELATPGDHELQVPEKPIPWAKVRTFFISLINRCPVLLSGGEPVSHSWAEAEIKVDGLVDDWKIRLDGELICFLLENGIEISLADVADLSGAIYNSRKDEYFDRILSVVQLLLREGIVEESSGGVLRLCRNVVV
ncbi:hypothetical protein GCM10009663_27380 [Kitasatospora arboriphila]|uniref:Uncharacterized protein n=1 Tax=Kitasatospora arboriphila TaxID=258052 RepID=A0ABN1TG55_9ACTN